MFHDRGAECRRMLADMPDPVQDADRRMDALAADG
jgi:hypothetical protein